jgi:glycosyltransferase involved in cell wall biosynthesis
MKIVSVMTTSALGGAEFAATELLDALAERGHHPVVLTDQATIARDSRVRMSGIDLGPKLSRASWPELMVRWPQLHWRLRAGLEAEWPYDVLLVHYKKEQLLAAELPRRLRSNLVWAEWGPVPYPLRRGFPRWLYVRSARPARAVMAVSEGTRRSLEEVGIPGERVDVVPNALRTDEIRFDPEGRERVRRRLGIPDDGFVVGCISRFHPKKRNDVVVDAVEALDGHAHLILAGGGETEDELRARAAPLADRAHFLPTPGAEVSEVLSAFDVSVFCPSPTEGAPRAVIIAMLAERPCLATGPEGVADILDGDVGGITSPENDPAALAARLQEYLHDPERRRREGSLARRRAVERFDAAVVAERAERLMRPPAEDT